MAAFDQRAVNTAGLVLSSAVWMFDGVDPGDMLTWSYSPDVHSIQPDQPRWSAYEKQAARVSSANQRRRLTTTDGNWFLSHGLYLPPRCV